MVYLQKRREERCACCLTGTLWRLRRTAVLSLNRKTMLRISCSSTPICSPFILENVEKQQKATKELYGYLDEVIKKIDNYRSINPFIPYELVITDKTPYLNKTVGSINFWQETFATVIAIRRNGTLIMSPGPEAVFRLNDIVYYTGDEDCPDRVRGFMYPNK